MKRFTVLLIILITNTLQAQDFSNYFRPPLDGVLLSSGNFAETRSNHFHSGVDIKTGGVEGKPLRAAAKGYISRVCIAPRGFGKTIYITHTNGTTTVYAHMQRFTPTVENYLRTERYRTQKHDIDLFLTPEKFPVEQGELIGYSGNTGASGGPHLHYEVRDAATQKPLNPIKTGAVKMTDNIPPTLVKLYYIAVDTAGIVPVTAAPRTIEIVRKVGSEYVLKDTSALVIGPCGYFVIEATDRKNGTQNTMGVYRTAVEMDGAALFGFRLDKFGFADTRYVNSLCYYPLQRGARNQFLRLARQEGNLLPVYSGGSGAVVLGDDGRHTILIEAEDDTGNIARLRFAVRREARGGMPVPEGRIVDRRHAFSHSDGGLKVTIPAGALYDNMFLSVSHEDAPAMRGTRYSPVYSVGSPQVPLHKAMTVSLRADSLPADLQAKACLGLVTADGKGLTYAGGRWSDGWVTGGSSVFGKFVVTADTTAPTVTPNFTDGADLAGRRSVAFTMRDDFSGIASFEGNIDGQWIIFERQGNTITHNFDPEKITYNGGKHTLRLTVRDAKGNATTLSRGFTR
jgi:hypothetical protein